MDLLIDLAVIGIWASIILVGLAIIAIAVAGVRSIGYGKVEKLSIGIVLVPIVLFIVLWLIFSGNANFTGTQAFANAGIWTSLIMFLAVMLGLAYTGVRGVFS